MNNNEFCFPHVVYDENEEEYYLYLEYLKCYIQRYVKCFNIYQFYSTVTDLAKFLG